MNQIKFLGLILCILFSPLLAKAQTVGVVLSGGGAKGAAHIGFLRALEKNNIPINYITGTSMGAVVGGLYASGYSVDEIEDILTQKSFSSIVAGELPSKELTVYNLEEIDPTLFSILLRIDSNYSTNLKIDINKDLLINYILMEKLAPASIAANCDFDSLYIPFRATASEVLTEKSIVLKEGKLDHAVRASMAVPLVYRPIKINNKYLFDGGLYNNFPADVMIKEFNPDIIIGSNVTNTILNKYPEKDEHLTSTNDIFLFIKKVNPNILRDTDFFIQPNISEYSANDFHLISEIIDSGYSATMHQMDSILLKIEDKVYSKDRFVKRFQFKKKIKPLIISDIQVIGLNQKQNQYIKKLIRKNEGGLNNQQLNQAYLKLAGERYFTNIYPELTYNEETGKYILTLSASPNKNILINLGGFLTSRSINTTFVSMEYNHLNKYLSKYYLNFYLGNFYNSAKAKIKLNIPAKIQYTLVGEYGYNQFDYLNSREINFDSDRTINLITRDHHISMKGLIPLSKNSRMEISQTLFDTRTKFSMNNDFNKDLNPDIVDSEGSKSTLSLIENTLNHKMYPNTGRKLQISTSIVGNKYYFSPGTGTSYLEKGTQSQWWTEIFGQYEEYHKFNTKIDYGIKVQAFYSSQSVLQDYYSTIVNAPAYHPLSDSKSFFISNLRSYKYISGGISGIYNISNKLSTRAEFHYFKPFSIFSKKENGGIEINEDILDTQFGHHTLSANIIYKSIVGPLSLSINYYDADETSYGIFLHFGYIIFNKRPSEY